MYEHRSKPLISAQAFYKRLLNHAAIMVLIVCFSLFVGMSGYHFVANLNWVDSFLNAAMILGGMGPVDVLTTEAAKIFAGFYALYSGLILIVSVGILMAPVFHRFLHKFHIENKSDD